MPRFARRHFSRHPCLASLVIHSERRKVYTIASDRTAKCERRNQARLAIWPNDWQYSHARRPSQSTSYLDTRRHARTATDTKADTAARVLQAIQNLTPVVHDNWAAIDTERTLP
jgi:hypothetical protein